MATTSDVSVRLARVTDAPAIAGLQVAAWLAAYGTELPRERLVDLTGDPEEHAEQWRAAVRTPPTPHHRVLVALAGAEPVGTAAFGPATDDDADPSDAELLTLTVDPAHRDEGHEDRLLAATVDHLRADGFRRATTWIDATDEATRSLLLAAGWDTDGSHRSLDLDGDGRVVLRQVRLHTDLGGAVREDEA